MTGSGAGRFEVNAGKVFPKTIERNPVRWGVAAASRTKSNAGGTGKRLPIAGQRNPETAANLLRRPRANDQRHRAVVVVEQRGVDRVERMLRVENHLTQRASRPVGGGEKKFHVRSVRPDLRSKLGCDLGKSWG